MTDKILVTSALPYANGSIHLGHLVEYIETDIYVRFLRLSGKDVIYMCADDTHGTPIEVKAKLLNKTPEELVAFYHEEHQRDFKEFEVAFDLYYSTNSEENRRYSEYIFQRLMEKGDIYQKEVALNYCANCLRFLPDRYIKGGCPKCKAPDQYGDVCEACGTTYSPTDLIEPYCTLCRSTPVKKTSRHYYFKLSNYTERLREWIHHSGALQEEVKNYVNQWILGGLKDWDISRDGPYFGFKIPGETDKYFYVWLDAPVGYIAATDKYCQIHQKDFNQYWRNSDTAIIHFIGKDIVYFHTLFWPAMLMGSDFNIPRRVVTHGMLTVNGEKMSKTRGTFINARTYLDFLDPQYLRYYYATKISKGNEDIDLSFEDFVNRVNSELVNKFANFSSRVIKFLGSRLDKKLGKIPAQTGSQQETILGHARAALKHYEELEVCRAMKEICEIADIGNLYFQAAAPWVLIKTDPEAARDICTYAINIIKILTILLKPVVPKYAEAMEGMLNLAPQTFLNIQFDLEGGAVNDFITLAERIEKAAVEKLIDAAKVEAPSPAEAQKELALAPLKPEIAYEDFARLDLRVGTVIAAEEVEGAKKLLKLTVDMGLKTMTLFAGIKGAYAPEAILNRQIILLANLKPRQMKFGVSEGMLIAGVYKEGEKELVVIPEFGKALPNGSQIF